MSTAIEIDDVVKTFGSTRALDGLDVSVRTGEVHGYLGPNGAGKSVTIRTLLGLLRHDSGTVRLLGGGEIIDYFGRLRGDLDTAKRDDLIERFELDPTKKSSTYSKGNRQKVALVTALSSDAELLILDEPTSGLDPLMETVFQTAIADAVDEGRTVFLSSHILAEVEKLCDRVTIIRNGRAVLTGTLDDLRATTRTSLTVAVQQPADGLDDQPGVHAAHTDDTGHLHVQVDTDRLGELMKFLSSFDIVSLVSQPPTLEELFLAEYDLAPTAPDDAPDR